MLTHTVGLRVSLGLALVALIMVALAENGRVPVDNPTTHLELTMVHEAMVLEYSGRHLALIELAAAPQAHLYLSLIACIYLPYGMALLRGRAARLLQGARRLPREARAARPPPWPCSRSPSPRCGCSGSASSSGGALMLGFLGTLLLFVSRAM